MSPDPRERWQDADASQRQFGRGGAHTSESIAAELAGWAASELPGQASARLAAWNAADRRSADPAPREAVGSPNAAETIR